MEDRKNPRLTNWDYSSNGAYFITVCTHRKQHVLGSIVGRGLAPAETEMSEYGMMVESQLLDLENRFKGLKVDKYSIMPNHVHVIFILENVAVASPRPTISDIVCVWKSLSSRVCGKMGLDSKLWQSSFYDHIIRDEQDYFVRWKYIDENPAKWAEDEYF